MPTSGIHFWSFLVDSLNVRLVSSALRRTVRSPA